MASKPELALHARTALVTGAGTGIGRAIAIALAREGAHVVAAGRRREPVEATCRRIHELGGEATALAADITAHDFAGRLDRVTRTVDVLVNNAAAFAPYAPLERVPEEAIDVVIDTVLAAPIRIARHLLPGMKERGFGRIVSLGTIAAESGAEGQVAYSAAKSGLIGFTRSVAAEGARFGVTANLVQPGLIATERIVQSVAGEWQRRILANTALQRPGTPEEVAEAVVFLCSPRASYITGAVLPVSGGYGVGLYARDIEGEFPRGD